MLNVKTSVHHVSCGTTCLKEQSGESWTTGKYDVVPEQQSFPPSCRFGFVLYWSMIFIYGETCNIVPCNLVFHEFFIMIYNWWRAVEYTYCRYWYWKCLSCKICSRYVLLQLFELRFYSIPHWVIPRRYTSTENCKRSKYIHGAKLHNKLLKCI